MALYKNKKIEIILPWRIGDAILNIPMLICLKQLNEKYQDNNKITLVAQPFLQKLYAPLEIFKCKSINTVSKIFSNINPADIAVFTETINSNWGYKAKITYGLTNPFKKIIKFTHELPSLNIKNLNELIPEELISFLQDKYKLSFYSISLFGILLELGYSSEQIINTFDFKPEYLALNNFDKYFHTVMNENYVVFCMEAAYGRKGDANRRWDEYFYVEIAERCYREFNLKSIFIGINKDFKLPNKSYLIDLRKKLNLYELACVLKSSVCYIGNDTAPLHIANIMQKPSIGAYFMQHSLTDFSPIFPKTNIQVFCPQNPNEIYEKFKQIYIEKKFNNSEADSNELNKINKIAVIFGAKIGDVINVQPVCRVLKQKYPDSKLVFVTWPVSKEIAGLIPEVDYVELFDNKGKGKNPFIFLKDALKIRFRHKIDLAVVINDSFTYTLIAFLTGARLRIGRHLLGSDILLNKKYELTKNDIEDTHVIHSYLKVLEPIGLKSNDYSTSLKTDFSENDIQYVNNLINEAGCSDYKLIGFSPCSALEHKDWTPEEGKRFIDLINQIPGYKIALTGDYVAKTYADKVKSLGTTDFFDLTCKTNIKQFMILLNKFEKLVTVDTGSAHLAYVLKIPTVVLFFNDLYKIWGPLNTELHKIIYNSDRNSLKAEEIIEKLYIKIKAVQ